MKMYLDLTKDVKAMNDEVKNVLTHDSAIAKDFDTYFKAFENPELWEDFSGLMAKHFGDDFIGIVPDKDECKLFVELSRKLVNFVLDAYKNADVTRFKIWKDEGKDEVLIKTDLKVKNVTQLINEAIDFGVMIGDADRVLTKNEVKDD